MKHGHDEAFLSTFGMRIGNLHDGHPPRCGDLHRADDNNVVTSDPFLSNPPVRIIGRGFSSMLHRSSTDVPKRQNKSRTVRNLSTTPATSLANRLNVISLRNRVRSLICIWRSHKSYPGHWNSTTVLGWIFIRRKGVRKEVKVNIPQLVSW